MSIVGFHIFKNQNYRMHLRDWLDGVAAGGDDSPFSWNVDTKIISNKCKSTLPETNIAPENIPSQKETNIPTIHF